MTGRQHPEDRSVSHPGGDPDGEFTSEGAAVGVTREASARRASPSVLTAQAGTHHRALLFVLLDGWTAWSLGRAGSWRRRAVTGPLRASRSGRATTAWASSSPGWRVFSTSSTRRQSGRAGNRHGTSRLTRYPTADGSSDAGEVVRRTVIGCVARAQLAEEDPGDITPSPSSTTRTLPPRSTPTSRWDGARPSGARRCSGGRGPGPRR